MHSERQQALARGILDSLHANPADTPPILLSGYCDQCFVFQVSAPQALFEPAPVAFIDFHRPGEQIPSRPHHRAPHFVQPGPSRFVPVEPQHSLQSQSAGSGHPPHRTKPQRQRAARVLKDGPGGHRGLAPTRSALQQHFSQRPRLSTTATRTAETVRPAQPEQILPAGLLTAKTGLELYQVLRVIFHLPAYYILGLPESTGYPPSRNTRQPRQVRLAFDETSPPVRRPASPISLPKIPASQEPSSSLWRKARPAALRGWSEPTGSSGRHLPLESAPKPILNTMRSSRVERPLRWFP